MIFMDDALNGITSPQDYIYIKILRLTLKSLGFWPGFILGEKTWKCAPYYGLFPLIMNASVFVSGIAFLVAHGAYYDFLHRGHIYITVFLGALITFRFYALPMNTKIQNIILQFMTSIHLFYHADKSEYARQVHIRIHKICHIAAVILFVQIILGVILFSVIPMYSNYSQGKLNYEVLVNSTYELAVYLYYPVDATTNRRSYYVLTIFNWYAAYMCYTVINMNDLLLFLIIFHIYGHFQILLNLLATIPRPAAVEVKNGDDVRLVNSLMYSEEESKEVTNKLKQCIDYHRFLLDFTDSMSKGFGPMLLSYFIFHQVACCLLLLECSQMTAEALIAYGPLTISVYQGLIQTCVIFETIGTMSEKLSDQVYAIPWECMDIKNRKIVLYFLMNVQTPVHVKAMGFTDVGVTTMVTIMKTSISYFTFLRTVPE